MSVEPLSAHGFMPAKGRGYDPEQVDRRLVELSQDRDAALERAAELTGLVRRTEGDAEQLRERVASLAPQTYKGLSPRAQQILALAAEESGAMRSEARDASSALRDAGEALGRQTRDAAREGADARRDEAEAYAQEVLLAARTTAEAERVAAREDANDRRGEALAALTEVRGRTTALIDDLEKTHSERLTAAERDITGRESASEVAYAERTAYATVQLEEAKRAFAETGEQARHSLEDAQARAAELVSLAEVGAERVTRDAERVVREQTEAREEMNAHMTHVRNSLAALTGRATVDG
jgi:hypothetical protein